MAKVSGPMRTSPSARNDPVVARASLRSVSQETSARGSLASICTGPVKSAPVGVTFETAADPHLGHAGGAKGEIIEGPGARAAAEVGAQPLQARAGKRHRVDADREPHRDRKLLQRGPALAEAMEHRERLAADRLGQHAKAVEIDLGRRQHRGELRLLAERQSGVATEPRGAVLGPVLQLDLVHGHRAAGAPHMAGQAKRLAGACASEAVAPLQVSVEVRHAAFGPERAVDVGEARLVRSVHRKVDPDRAVGGRAVRRQVIGIRLTRDVERAVTLDGTGERAQLAAEGEFFEVQRAAAARIGERQAAVLDGDAVHRQGLGIGTGGPTIRNGRSGRGRARPRDPSPQDWQRETRPASARRGRTRFAATAPGRPALPAWPRSPAASPSASGEDGPRSGRRSSHRGRSAAGPSSRRRRETGPNRQTGGPPAPSPAPG